MATVMAVIPTPSLIQGRISTTSFRIVTIVTFVFALLTVTCRLFVLTLQQRKRLGLDDVFLIFATIFLLAATITVLISLDQIYFVESLTLNGAAAIISNGTNDWIDQITYFSKINWAYNAVTWASIFFIKFSFLTFFSGLCDRLPKAELYRKIVYGFCVVVFLYTVLDGIVDCPHLGLDALQCATPDAIERSLAIGTASITLDVVTDAAILVIPVALLWKVKLATHQKIAIGTFLCLSAVMIILAIIRAAGVHYYSNTDNSWTFLWQQVEASAAVTMFSLTAFRSVFTTSARSSRGVPWKASIPRFIKRTRTNSISSQRHLYDISIPSATMTGMKTTIENMKGDISFPEQLVASQSISLPAKAYTT